MDKLVMGLLASFVLPASGGALIEKPEGAQVRIVGTAHALEQRLKSPASQRECVGWRLRLVDADRNRPLMVLEEVIPFAIENSRRRFEVSPADAELLAKADLCGEQRVSALPDGVRALLGDALAPDQRVLWEETVLSVGAPCEVSARLDNGFLVAPPGARLRIRT